MTKINGRPQNPERNQIHDLTPAARSERASRARFRLTQEQAALLTERYKVIDSWYEAISAIHLDTFEPANIFVPNKWDHTPKENI